MADGLRKNIVSVMAVLFWGFILYYAYTQQMGRAYLGVLFLGAVITIYIVDELGESLAEGDHLDTGLLLSSGIVTIITTVYMALNHDALYTVRVGRSYTHEYILAAAFVVAILYLTWRSFGKLIPVMVLLTIGYGYFGPMIPGMLGHGGLSSTRILQVLLLDSAGIYGSLNRLIAAWVAIFLLYAGLMHGFGAFDLIVQAAMKASQYTTSGAAQAAVIASAIIGSINGSATANAGMTGSLTIPMMKENGLKPATAAGIESSASTLGQIMPPVMGASAFLMAGFLIVPYAQVMYAAAIPALVLIVVIAVAVHFVASQELEDAEIDINKIDTDDIDNEIQDTRELLVQGVRYGLPFAVLIYTLGVAQWTIPTAALYTCATMFATGILFPIFQERGVSPDLAVDLGRQTVDGLRFGVITLAPIAIIVAAINGMVDLLMATGVPGTVTLALVDMSGGIMFFAVLVAMVVSLILGLGMPNVAAYSLVAILVAPSLIDVFLIPEFAAHFFVFYAVVIGGITPPVAIVCAVAAGIAGAKFMDVCWMALKLFSPVFVIPFAFIYHPEIVAPNFGMERLVSAMFLLIGSIGLVYGGTFRTEAGQLVRRTWQAIFIAVGTVGMVFPGFWIRAAAVTMVLVLFVLHYHPSDVACRLTGRAESA